LSVSKNVEPELLGPAVTWCSNRVVYDQRMGASFIMWIFLDVVRLSTLR
jgi:hypothetical protein